MIFKFTTCCRCADIAAILLLFSHNIDISKLQANKQFKFFKDRLADPVKTDFSLDGLILPRITVNVHTVKPVFERHLYLSATCI